MSGLYRWSTKHSGGNEKTFGIAQEKLQEKVNFNLANARRLSVEPATYFFPEGYPDGKMPSPDSLSPCGFYEKYPKIRPL